MKSGDLVNFHTDAWVLEGAKASYASPGIILTIYNKMESGRFTADVFWADGKTTTEHSSFLRATG